MNALKIEHPFEKRNRLWREVVETVILTIIMFVIINLAVQNYDVEGPSMEPSLHNYERIMVDKVSYRLHDPSRGDVVVFIAPPDPRLNYVKRVIAVPGDVLTIKGNAVTVDGVTLKEPYVAPDRQGNPYSFKTIDHMVIPPNKYWVMGDDRVNSSDSRDWGLLPQGNIIGRAALVYWPFGQNNDGFLPNYSSVFAQVHQPASKTGNTGLILQNATDRSTHPGTFVMDELWIGVLPALYLLSSKLRRRKRQRRAGNSDGMCGVEHQLPIS